MSHSDDGETTAPAGGGVGTLLVGGRVWRNDLALSAPLASPLAVPVSDGRRVALFAKIVVVGMALSLVVTFILTHYLHLGFPYTTFLVGASDCCMDFFNVNCYSYNLDPYSTRVPYPPFAILLARAFSCGFDYAAHGPIAAQASLAGRLSCLALLGAFGGFFCTVVYRGIRTGNRARDLQLALVLCLSYPVLFLLDRGNYLMVAFAGVFGFIHWYEHKPWLANFCLAVAISVKIYPLLFVLLLANDRRWRDCATVLALTAALNFGALLMFKGNMVTNAHLFLRNLLAFSQGFPTVIDDGAWNLSFTNLIRMPYVMFMQRGPHNLLQYYPLFTLAVLGLVLYALRTERIFWKKVLIVTIAQIQVPGYSADYNLVYLVIPLLLYFREKGELSREDYFYIVCAGLLFVPKGYHVLGLKELLVLTSQGFLNPLLLLALFLKVVLPRSGKFVLGAGGLVFAAGTACCCGPVSDVPFILPHPYLGMKGIDGDWLLREGFTLTAPTDFLRQRPVICARGRNLSQTLLGGKLPGLKATLIIPKRRRTTVPGSLVPDGGDYVLTVNLAHCDLPEGRPAEIQISFHGWFVPKQLGLNEDARKLVIPGPYSLTLLPAPATLPAAGAKR
jgi:hypothetical protein